MRSQRILTWSLVILLVVSGLTGALAYTREEGTDREGGSEELKTSNGGEEVKSLADSPWPKFRGNKRNTGLSTYDTSHVDGTEKWNFTTSDVVYSSLAIGGDGTIYTGSDDNYVYALNPDGTKKWSYLTEGEVRASPAIDDNGMIYVGGGSKLYSLFPDGSLNWTYTTDNTIYSAPAIGDDGTIYLGTAEEPVPGFPPVKFITALYPNGTLKWQNQIADSGVISSPAVGPNGTIYIGSPNNNLYAFYPNGTEKWNYTTHYSIYSSPSVDSNGIIYIGSNDGNFYAVHPIGTEKWSFSTGNNVQSSPAIGSGGTIYVGSDDNNLYAINPDGTEEWNFSTGDNVQSSPAIGSDGTIYVGSDDNNLYAVNQDGTQKWNFTTSATIYSSPAIGSDGTVYVGSTDSNIYAIGWSTTSSYSLELTAGGNSSGWNFVSFNLIPVDDSLVSILNDSDTGIAGNYDKVMYYDSGEDEWKTYCPIRPSHYNNLEKWNHTMGLWIHMTADDNLTINGTKPSSTDIPLQPGWNMVGYPSATNKLANDALPAEVSKIGVFNESKKYNLNYIYELDTYTMKDGEGYWVYNDADYNVKWTVEY